MSCSILPELTHDILLRHLVQPVYHTLEADLGGLVQASLISGPTWVGAFLRIF